MYKAVLLFKLLFMSFFTHSAAIELSTGVGTQYGGIGGQQLAIRLDESKYFVAIGFLGASAGAQYQISDNSRHTMGVNFGRLLGILRDDTDYVALTYNYHLTGFHNSGFEIGTGLGVYHRDESTFLSGIEIEEKTTEPTLIFNIGYKF
ncbi:hypothetical protein J8M21_11200 [Pseudoalteromonas luteoviolacea]|uniref:hypothetical protein n=1 Tax=Pseudoalteromonas luteoviolacea TaxID=43657 RepID=UPI001B3A300A|nr:hypothetical protein [Pseudoalteromonas luteoviolacea]MBQ4877774.1 hypothetical protein [Pseudoalteromonas luteoviolacea]MBQ4906780.1 hypothetical protein [Pseudoalteromonas luteoviolacea]